MRPAKLIRALYLTLGWLFLLLGIVGVFLPLLPTAPFVIVAVFCFERSSPRLHQWVLRQPHLGAAVGDWQSHRVIRPQAKILAVTLITAGIGTSVLTTPMPHPVAATAVIVGIGVSAFILSTKNHPPPTTDQKHNNARN